MPRAYIMPAIPTTAYDELLAAGFTDHMTARHLRGGVPEAMEQMRHRREVEAVNDSNFPAEVIEHWGVGGVPWKEINRRR